MKKYYLKGFVLMSVFILLMVGMCMYKPVQARELRIGHSTPLTGGLAVLGLQAKRALEMIAEEYNKAGGIKIGDNQYQIKIITADTGDTSTGGATAVNKLIYKDRVHFLLHLGGGARPAVQEIAKRKKMIMFGEATQKESIGSDLPYTFKSLMAAYEATPSLFKWFNKKHPEIKSVYILQPDGPSGYAIAEATQKSAEYYGIRVLGTDFTARTVTDYYPILNKILPLKPDLIVPQSTSAGALFVKQARNRGYKGLFILGAQTSSDYTRIGTPKATDGMASCTYDFTSELMPKGVREFAKQYKAKYKQTLSSYIGIFAVDLQVVLKASQKAGNLEDVDQIKRIIETGKFDTMWGRIFYGGKDIYGIGHQGMLPVIITVFKDGKLTAVKKIPPANVLDTMLKVYKK